MTSQITGTYSSGIVLTAGSYTNPVTVTSTGSIYNGGGNALYAASSWTIENDGSIGGGTGPGITLNDGGTVTDAAGGTITGGNYGIMVENAAGTVLNAGSISGVRLDGGGYLSNAASGTIYDANRGVTFYSTAGTVQNAGSIGGGNEGLYLGSGGTVTNAVGATITGGNAGVFIYQTAGTVMNAGSIGGGYQGIQLNDGGYVSNALGGTITGGNKGGNADGVAISSAPGTVENAGSISGGAQGNGVRLNDGGTVSNAAGATIASGGTGNYSGVNVGSAAGTVENAGSIFGSYYGVQLNTGGSVINAAGGGISGNLHGVRLGQGGYVSNAAGGTIHGASYGVSADGAAGTIVNAGSIGGVEGVGLFAGGFLTNAAGGTITGSYVGIQTRYGTATIENAGKISGVNHAVSFHGTYAHRLIVDAGAVFSGDVVTEGASNTIELTSSASAGAISGIGDQFTGFQTVTIDSGASWTVKGDLSGVTIGGFAGTDALDLTNIAFASGETAFLNRTTDILTIKNAGGSTLGSVQLSGAFTPQNQFHIASDGASGIKITETVAAVSQISGTYSSGVVLAAGSYTNPVTVTSTGSIATSSGNAISAATSWTVNNKGHITATSSSTGTGIVLTAGGTVSNAVGGVISGAKAGVYAGGSAAVQNAGTITGTSKYGVGLYGGGSVTNLAGRTITSGQWGVVVKGAAGTVENAGTITGTTNAVYFNETFANRLIVDAGAKFTGTVTAKGASNTIELTSAASTGTLSGVGSKYTGFGTIAIDSGAKWTISGAMAGFSGITVGGFNSHDTLDLTDVGFTAGETVTLDGSDLLTIKTAGGTTLDTLQLSGSFTGQPFHVASDGGSGTNITVNCFLRGTRILTESGEVAVEELKVGDRVVTRFGGAQPIKWVARQSYAAQFLGPNSDRWPVCVTSGALGDGLPLSDLYLSTGHGLLVDGILVPVELLLNGTTIFRVSGLDRIDYFHLEFAAHDCVSAHGLWAESFADTGNRMSFHNHAEFGALYPDHVQILDAFCAPRPELGDARLEAVRARLGFDEATAYTGDPELALVVDGVRHGPEWNDGWTHRFRIDAGARRLMLASLSDVPMRAMPGNPDGRWLGMAVYAVRVIGAGARLEIGSDWSGFGEGFHADEGKHRWTNGGGALSAALLAPFTGPVTIEIDGHGLERYRLGMAAKQPMQGAG